MRTGVGGDPVGGDAAGLHVERGPRGLDQLGRPPLQLVVRRGALHLTLAAFLAGRADPAVRDRVADQAGALGREDRLDQRPAGVVGAERLRLRVAEDLLERAPHGRRTVRRTAVEARALRLEPELQRTVVLVDDGSVDGAHQVVVKAMA